MCGGCGVCGVCGCCMNCVWLSKNGLFAPKSSSLCVWGVNGWVVVGGGRGGCGGGCGVTAVVAVGLLAMLPTQCSGAAVCGSVCDMYTCTAAQF